MSVYRLREGDEKGGISAEGGEAIGVGLPSLLHKIEEIVGDRARPPETRGEEIRRLCVEYMKAPKVGGELTPAAESFCRAITGRGKRDTAPLSESGDRGITQLLEAEKTIDRIGRRFLGVAKNGRDFFKRVTSK